MTVHEVRGRLNMGREAGLQPLVTGGCHKVDMFLFVSIYGVTLPFNCQSTGMLPRMACAELCSVEGCVAQILHRPRFLVLWSRVDNWRLSWQPALLRYVPDRWVLLVGFGFQFCVHVHSHPAVNTHRCSTGLGLCSDPLPRHTAGSLCCSELSGAHSFWGLLSRPC